MNLETAFESRGRTGKSESVKQNSKTEDRQGDFAFLHFPVHTVSPVVNIFSVDVGRHTHAAVFLVCCQEPCCFSSSSICAAGMWPSTRLPLGKTSAGVPSTPIFSEKARMSLIGVSHLAAAAGFLPSSM